MIFLPLHIDRTEHHLPPKAATTTTPTPYVFTTTKPRRKQHQNHNHKGTHDTSSRAKDALLPNLQENEIVGPGAGGSLEGMFASLQLAYIPFVEYLHFPAQALVSITAKK